MIKNNRAALDRTAHTSTGKNLVGQRRPERELHAYAVVA
jgi:hypothetical protein